MTRPKSSKSNHKVVEDSVTVATDPEPLPPITRKKTAAAAVVAESPKKMKKHRRSKSKSEDDDVEIASAVADKAEKAKVKAKAAKVSSATKKELDRSLRKAKKVVNDLSDSFEATPHWPLPGALFQNLEERKAVFKSISVFAFLSVFLSTGTRIILSKLPSLWSQTWVSWDKYLVTEELPSVGSIISAFVIRFLKLSVAYGTYNTVPNLVAINILCYAPIIYLLSSYYNVPLSAALFSESISFFSELMPIYVDLFTFGEEIEDEIEDEDEDGGVSLVDTAVFDFTSFAYTAVYAAALYGFTFVQACRFFLPSTLVVHFFGIATVEPARAHPLSRSDPLTLSEVFLAVFQSVSAMLLNLACGVAARFYIFNYSYGPNDLNPRITRSAALHRRIITLRSAAASVTVGLSIFFYCLFNIQGVDAVGASAFASIWAVAPLLVGAGLGYAGV
ncbi:hypothetical protein SEUCBS139899_005373 [Sporothrix eucalyptigena]